MVLIDSSTLTVASPRLRADFGPEPASVQWCYCRSPRRMMP
jgi:hypothetical protein